MFADRGRVVSVLSRQLEKSFLAQVVAVVVIVEIRQNLVVFNKRSNRSCRLAEVPAVEHGIP